MATAVPDLDFVSGCGKTKGCLLYPRDCSGGDCSHAVAFTPHPSDHMIHFEMYVKHPPAYVSLGFSEDKIMVCAFRIVSIIYTYCVRPLIVASLLPTCFAL